jgi:hypothetical protein
MQTYNFNWLLGKILCGNAWSDQPPRARENQEKRSGGVQLQSGGPRTGLFCEAAYESVRLLVRRGAVHGSTCGLSRCMVHAARGGLWMRCDQRKGPIERRSMGPAYSMALALYVSCVYTYVSYVSSRCCMCVHPDVVRASFRCCIFCNSYTRMCGSVCFKFFIYFRRML